VRGFERRLALIVLAGLVVRVLYAVTLATKTTVQGDALAYHVLANLLADGHGYIRPYDWLATGQSIPTAEHPPLYSVLLAGVSELGGRSFLAHRLASCVMGAAAVALAGVAGRAAAGERVGLLTTAIAAAHPAWWVNDGALMSESLYLATAAGVLAAALGLLRSPTRRRAAVAGAAVGLAALTRSEALALIAVLVIPAIWMGAARRRSAVAPAIVAVAAFAAVLAPWEARGVAKFDRLIPVTTTGGSLLAGANCDATYHGQTIGLWRLDCVLAAQRRAGGRSDNEAERFSRAGAEGRSYARHHLGRLPVVMAVRVARTWDVFRPRDQAHYETFEGRHLRVSEAAVLVHYVLLLLALAGAATLWRARRRVLAVLLIPCVLVTIVSATGYGVTRLRVGAEPSLAVLGAIGIAALADVRRRRRDGMQPA
jgi:4-amino-4-deoxy-L-arabinose transferase-like glycosyltransferase